MELVWSLAAAAMLAWGAVLLTRLPMLWAVLAYLVAACCFSHPFAHWEIAGVTLTLDRLLLVAVVGMAVVQARLRPQWRRRWGGGEWCTVALVAFLGTSMLWAQAGVPPGEEPPLHRWLQGYAIPGVLYLLGYHMPLGPRWLRHLWAGLLGFGFYLAWTGVAESQGWYGLVWPQYIADPSVGLHFGRARGPMVQSVSFGLYLGTCLLAALALARLRPGKLRWLLAVFVPLALAALVATWTRSVWLGTAGALTLWGWFHTPPRWRRWVWGTVATVGLVVGVLFWNQLVALRREGGSALLTRQSTSMRAAFAYVSWKMFLDHPLLGVGFGAFPQAKLPYLMDRTTPLHLEAIRHFAHHNTYLSILTEAGLVGLGLYLATLAHWVRAAWVLIHSGKKSTQDPYPQGIQLLGLFMLGVLVLYGCQAMFHETSYTPLDHALVFFLAGVVRQRAQAVSETRAL